MYKNVVVEIIVFLKLKSHCTEKGKNATLFSIV